MIKLDLENIKLSKQDENALWFCIADLKNHNVSSDFYYGIYRRLRYDLGIDSVDVLETEYRKSCNADFYFEVFKNYFYNSSVKDRMAFIEIFFNNLLIALYLSVVNKIVDIYGDTKIPDDLTFEYLRGCDGYNNYSSYSFSFNDLEEFIEKANDNINKVNKILEKCEIKYALINKIGVSDLSQKVYEFVKVCNNISEDIITFVKKTELYTFDKIVQPVIMLTNNLTYKSANKEFLRGLNSFKIGNYVDCVNGVASSLESTIKIICDYKSYKYKGSEQLNDLVDILFKNGFFDFYTDRQKEDMKLTLKKNIGFIRNTATAHGTGRIDKIVEEHTAKYVINMGASLIMYLIDIYEDTK